MQGNRGGHNRGKGQLQVKCVRKRNKAPPTDQQVYEWVKQGVSLATIGKQFKRKSRNQFADDINKNDALHWAVADGELELELEFLAQLNDIIADGQRDRTQAIKLKAELVGRLRNTLELTGADGAAIETRDISKLSDEELERRFMELQKELTTENK